MIIHFLKTAPAALSLLALFFWAGCAPEDPPPEKKADPNPVTSFVATPYDARVVLGWTNPTDAGFAGVLIMRRSDGTYPASTQDGTLVYDGSSQTYQDTTVTNDTTYHYAAFAYYDSSVYSAAAQASATPSAGLVYSPGNLKITEVGSAYYSNSSNWIEIYNASAEPAQLASYSLRTLWGWWDGYTFDSAEAAIALPTATVPAGGYMLVRGAPPDTPTQNTAQVVYVSDGQGRVPYWDSDGYAELILDGATADFVRFGSSGSAPTTASAWGAGAAPALPNHDLSYGYSIARDGSNTDSDVAGDWYSRDFATPGGPNDVTCLLDEDQDGIPDCSEEPGSTFAGLPLYDWGARTGQRDVFIHLNYMQSTDEGLIPRRESLAKINSVFASRGISIHWDVGDIFHPAGGISPADFDLGGGGAVPFAVSADFEEGPLAEASLYTYKYTYMPLPRRQIFHYMLMANTYKDQGSDGPWGLAEINGNDILILMGQSGLNSDTTEDLNSLINYQASTLMHEFGHNLGLKHGGNVSANYKPNYLSIMNYLYSNIGLPEVGNNEGDRYFYNRNLSGGNCPGFVYYSDLTNPPTASPALFRLDFSDGSGLAIDENHVNENLGLGRAASQPVDFDCDGTIENDIALNLNPDDPAPAGVLTDYDDWSNINLIFQRDWWADFFAPRLGQPLFRDPVGDDRQQVIIDNLRPHRMSGGH